MSSSSSADGKHRVYLLQLGQGRYYVGSTSQDLVDRLLDHHGTKTGAAFAQAWGVHGIRELSVHDDAASALVGELTATLQQMHEHGIDMVRGGPYTAVVELPDIDRRCISRLLNHLYGRCRICASVGHFADVCPMRAQEEEGEDGNGQSPGRNCCYLCGEAGHFFSRCPARAAAEEAEAAGAGAGTGTAAASAAASAAAAIATAAAATAVVVEGAPPLLPVPSGHSESIATAAMAVATALAGAALSVSASVGALAAALSPFRAAPATPPPATAAPAAPAPAAAPAAAPGSPSPSSQPASPSAAASTSPARGEAQQQQQQLPRFCTRCQHHSHSVAQCYATMSIHGRRLVGRPPASPPKLSRGPIRVVHGGGMAVPGLGVVQVAAAAAPQVRAPPGSSAPGAP